MYVFNLTKININIAHLKQNELLIKTFDYEFITKYLNGQSCEEAIVYYTDISLTSLKLLYQRYKDILIIKKPRAYQFFIPIF